MLSERDKMLRGDLYSAADPELVAARQHTRRLLRQFNASDEDERAQLMAQLLGMFGEGTYIEPPFYCDYGQNIMLGRNVYFNFNCIILDVAPVEIGDSALFGPNVQIYTATHPLDVETRRTGLELGKPIRIGSETWIGGSAVILPGVIIGARTVIGAGSVVTRDLPDDVFAAGNPCRVIRQLA